MNVLDRAIEAVAPAWALHRARARLALRHFEGSKVTRRNKNWRTPSTDANSALEGGLQRLRDRSRDLARNNGYAGRGIGVIQSNLVGRGVRPIFIAKSKKKKDLAEGLWRDWSEAGVDVEGIRSVSSAQSHSVRTMVESGECLLRRVWVPYKDGPIRMRLQILEPDYVDLQKSQALSDGGRVIQGVEFDPLGRRRALWLHSQHPGDGYQGLVSTFTSSKRVPADEVVSMFRRDRAGQVHGVPWLSALLITVRDLQDWWSNKLLREKLAACFVGFRITDQDPANPESKDPVQELNPGTIEVVSATEKFEWSNPPQPTGDGDFAKQHLMLLAAGLGITYESLTGDYQNATFSSARMGWLEMHRNLVEWRTDLVIPQWCRTVWRWFVEAAAIEGHDLSGVRPQWSEPRREMIDPTKEVPAIRDSVRSGLMSLSEAIRQTTGMDPDDVLAELAADVKRAKELGLTLDSDGANKVNGPAGNADGEKKEEGNAEAA